MKVVDFEDFEKIDIRVGTIVSARKNEKAKKPAYVLEIDFGSEIGIKKSSAQIVDRYSPESLVGKKIFAVVNFATKQVADVLSEVLVLGAYSAGGVVLATLDDGAQNGDRLG